MLTGYKDTDFIILMKLDDRSLMEFCVSSGKLEYEKKLCSNEDFWRERLWKYYEKFYPEEGQKWKTLYLKLIYDMDYIHEAMKKERIANLTVGREDEDKKQYSKEEIENFFLQHNEKIEGAVKKMYLDYRKDGDLDELRHAEFDWFREYLYDEEFLPYENFLK